MGKMSDFAIYDINVKILVKKNISCMFQFVQNNLTFFINFQIIFNIYSATLVNIFPSQMKNHIFFSHRL